MCHKFNQRRGNSRADLWCWRYRLRSRLQPGEDALAGIRWPVGVRGFRRTMLELIENLASTARTKVLPLNGKRHIRALAALPIIELNVGPVRLSLGPKEYGRRMESPSLNTGWSTRNKKAAALYVSELQALESALALTTAMPQEPYAGSYAQRATGTCLGTCGMTQTHWNVLRNIFADRPLFKCLGSG